ncbi:hypothetical protein NOF55_02915 [Rhizobiaceae bacterium BDR2-2]|uniref:Uncharacterized protein n=1 Tax=Ectorhizobium quercum TaxID=2965071 RepID=A0AAE3MXG0_9HYPH|nr:hypothetical protein [Ectorhizobium quercum]MCX8996046.1 hypothetical protein [Ectorhizobium quercum]
MRRSTEAFAQYIARPGPENRPGAWARLRLWLRDHANRLVPVAAGACAVAIGVIVAMPMLRSPLPSTAEAPTTVSRQRAPDIADEQSAQPGTRMGIRPAPVPMPRTVDPQSQPVLERYSFGDFELGVINTPDTVAIYLLEGNLQRQLEITRKDAGVTGAITDAFTYQPGSEAPQLLLIRFRLGEDEGWKVFARSGAGYAFSSEMTAIAENAPDRAEAERRLGGAP